MRSEAMLKSFSIKFQQVWLLTDLRNKPFLNFHFLHAIFLSFTFFASFKCFLKIIDDVIQRWVPTCHIWLSTLLYHIKWNNRRFHEMMMCSGRWFWRLLFPDVTQLIHVVLHFQLNSQHNFHRLSLTTTLPSLQFDIRMVRLGQVFAILNEIKINLVTIWKHVARRRLGRRWNNRRRHRVLSFNGCLLLMSFIRSEIKRCWTLSDNHWFKQISLNNKLTKKLIFHS